MDALKASSHLSGTPRELLHALPAWLSSALAGVAFHGLVQFIEIDIFLPHMLFAAILFVIPAFVYIDVGLCSATPSDSAARLVCFALGLAASVLVYRAFFHRLRRFPGPFAARLSKLHAVYLSTNFQYNLELQKQHAQYGDIVRTAIAKYDENIQGAAKELVDLLLDSKGKPVDITEYMSWFAYDVMGLVGFGRDFGQLRTRGGDSAVQGLREQMKFLAFMKHIPWVINVALYIPGASGMEKFVDSCRQLVVEKKKTWNPDDKSSTTNDILSWLLKAFHDKAPYASPSKYALDEDSRIIVIAGSDTTSGTLANLLYYLVRHPQYYTALQAHLDALFPTKHFSYTRLTDQSDPAADAALTLLDAIIAETLRLKPAIPSGNGRTTPPQGLRIDAETWLPGNVDVYMPQWAIQRDERYFVSPDDFVPERWVPGSGKEDWVREKAAWWPFQSGMYACPGRQLAYMEMRSAVAHIALRFDVGVPEGAEEEVKTFDERTLDTFSLAAPPLRLRFTERKAV
ncbi:Cytochrome p450 [Neofusicoccum parvum]|uniref:Cytochrome p450 n=1 Tax=Neofusicoccum parvum TaxID=310453 RepID=A0ACB5S6N1_9PEZI|nr:Cytochrome p450 [Neofusicoccum parvum]